jgi:hypothetical protein
VGRSDDDIGEWQEPLLSEFLEDALSETGQSCEDEEMGRL